MQIKKKKLHYTLKYICFYNRSSRIKTYIPNSLKTISTANSIELINQVTPQPNTCHFHNSSFYSNFCKTVIRSHAVNVYTHNNVYCVFGCNFLTHFPHNDCFSNSFERKFKHCPDDSNMETKCLSNCTEPNLFIILSMQQSRSTGQLLPH